MLNVIDGMVDDRDKIAKMWHAMKSPAFRYKNN
jgi:hypothetical protein